ncbi:MAG TPA: rRNA maturation RNase YbeY [Egibacteraceae bacterium]|nr:rRNA maturation RNase YbeY [Egibacteraceae bacterium]
MAVFVADEQAGSGAAPDVDVERLQRLARHVLADRRVPDGMELSVLCVDADDMAELNGHHMGKQGPTDVLAFPMDLPGETLPGEPAILGDVVLCPAVAAAQAAEHGKTFAAELELLLVHGILHLLGHDHAEPAERAEMFGLTDRLLASFAAEPSTAERGEHP